MHRVSQATADAIHHAATAVQHSLAPAAHHAQHAARVASHHAGNALRAIAHHGGNAAHAARDGTVAVAGAVQRTVSDVADAVGQAAGHAASAVGEHVGPAASAAKARAQQVGGAIATRTQPLTDAVGSWWTSLSEQHKGMVKVAVLLVGVRLLLRGEGRPRVADRAAEDIGTLLQKLQAAVAAKVQQALPRNDAPGKDTEKKDEAPSVKDGQSSTHSGPLPAAQRCVEQTLASLQHTGAAALGALQCAADGAVKRVTQLSDKPNTRAKPYLG